MKQKAFTIVELLVVITVIGVLAAIITISYTGITQKANTISVKSDLKQSSNLLSIYQVYNEHYPDSIDLINSGQGLPSSNGVTYSYTKISDNAFCLTARHKDLANIGYFITQKNSIPTQGFCPGDAPPLTMENSVVSTTAGSGVQGFADGPAASAMFYLPRGLVVDDSGNIYVADTLNNRIRTINPEGSVLTLAGDGTSSSIDGTGASARFGMPSDIAMDNFGNFFTVDNSGNRIRKITPSGVVSTLAGSGVSGFTDGPAAISQFKYPYGIGADSSGNIYVADTGNNRIRKITSDGVVSTFAGSGVSGFADGSAAVAKFNGPYDVAIDSSGNAYVADFYNNRIRKITPDGLVSTLAGHTYGSSGSSDGIGSSALFNRPVRIDTDRFNNIYVSDSSNNRIRKITPAGLVSTLAGSSVGYVDGTSVNARFSNPWGLTVDSSGNIYICDSSNNRIRKISLE